MMQQGLIAIFGLVGVFLRFYINGVVHNRFGTDFPGATLFINCSGSFLIGAIYVLTYEKHIFSADIGIAIMVGLLGGFTTFSGFSLDCFQSIESGKLFYALNYIVCSVAGGILATYLGFALFRKMF